MIAGIWPLVSYRNAEFLHNEVPSVRVTPSIMMTQRLLILDDDADILQLLKHSLSGYEVHAFSRGVDAAIAVLEALRDGNQFDCLLLDCALPHFDGFTVTKIARLAEATGMSNKRIKIAVFTAYAQTVENSTLIEESGADKYWRKPDDICDLPRLLSEWFEIREE